MKYSSNIILLSFLLITFGLNSIDQNRINIGVPMGTTIKSSYFKNNEINNGAGYIISRSKPTILNEDIAEKCREKCLIDGEQCFDDCVCAQCWKNSLGSQSELIDKCKCVSPDTTKFQHF